MNTNKLSNNYFIKKVRRGDYFFIRLLHSFLLRGHFGDSFFPKIKNEAFIITNKVSILRFFPKPMSYHLQFAGT
jgi:hypothetical protein